MKRSPLARRKPLRSVGRLRSRSTRRVIPPVVRDEVRARSGGRCEAAGITHDCMGAATQMHHIVLRAQGGRDRAENLLHVCTIAHMAIHANPSLAMALGYMKSREAPRPEQGARDGEPVPTG